MRDTLTGRSPGVRPAGSWAPTVQRAMLRAPSAARWNYLARRALIVFLVSLVPCMVMGAMGANGIFYDPFSDVALALYATGVLFMFFTAAMATRARRREYRHGYTTLDCFGKYSLYYVTLPQLEPRTGIELRAPGQTRLDTDTLRERTSLARSAGIAALPRMRPREAESTAAAAKLANDVQLSKARKAPTQRETLIRVLGPEAGNERAKALRLIIVTSIVGFGLIPVSAITMCIGTEVTGSALWSLPLAAVLLSVGILLRLSRRATSKATRLAETRMGLPSGSLPKWPLLKPIPAASLHPVRDADVRAGAGQAT
ncbi:hypothetical protein AL755_15780 [Arthrobacter sp. ERGS1:01]|uniref:hypothetical protein n=1 Tax=Arthrobacter sp. ERGS1:01 TaxID=1704044 RepID=UPI0006B48950|nr:hypothetical protein [Arthrobacter sp. ERGS1:01]ALE06579.1 hypothetical protein AL755_15780 [Arthrobacter sp. ERGS1:01]